MVRRGIALGVLAVVLAVVGVVADATPRAQPVEATFPGGNGKIAFVSDRDGNQEIYVMDPDGSNQTNITNDAADDFDPSWSADGEQIAFASDRSGNSEIFVMNKDGSGAHQITGDPGWDNMPSWSPNDERIAFVSDRDGTDEIHVMDADGSNVHQITFNEGNGFSLTPAWSPTGATIAYVAVNATINTMTPGGIFVEYLAIGEQPDWASDTSRIVFVRKLGSTCGFALGEAAVPRPSNGETTQITECGRGRWYDSDPAYSPDGRFVAFSRHETVADGTIMRMASEGGVPISLTNNEALNTKPSWQPIVAGNANCQGGIDAIDAAIVLQYAAGLVGTLPCEDDADVNGDGDIDSVDAALILQFSAGLLDSLPA